MQRSNPKFSFIWGRPHYSVRANRYAPLSSDTPAPHTMDSQDGQNMIYSMLRELQASVNDLHIDNRDLRKETSEHTAALSAVLNSTQRMSTAVVNLEASVAGQNERIFRLEDDRNMLSRKLHTLEDRLAELSTSSSSSSSSKHMLWAMETKADAANSDAVSGSIFAKPNKDCEASSSWNPGSIAQALQTEVNTVSRHDVNGAFRIKAGGSGRSGAIAANTFLQQKKPLCPRGMKIAREQTQLTMMRRNCFTPISDLINNVISHNPDLRGLKVLVAGDASNLFLSYHNKREAFNPRSEAVTFIYPVWLHLPYPNTKGSKTLFRYDRTKLENMDSNFVYNTIKQVLVPPVRTPPEIDMTRRGASSRGRENEREGGRKAARQDAEGGPARAHGNA